MNERNFRDGNFEDIWVYGTWKQFLEEYSVSESNFKRVGRLLFQNQNFVFT